MSKLVVTQGNKKHSIEFKAPAKLSDILEKNEIKHLQPCAGNGTCGNCRLKATGKLSEPTSAEISHLSEKLQNDIRLSCQIELLGDSEIEISEEYQTMSVLQSIENIELVYDGNSGDSYGFAVDIGTTTIASYLYHLPSARLCSTTGKMNEQFNFGADIIARIEYSNEHGVQPLQKAIINQLTEMFSDAIKKENISPEQISRVVLTGNTTMLHLLTGKDPAGIGRSPFIPESYFGYTLAATELFGDTMPNAEVYLPPCISAYVGADIVCGVIATNLTEHSENSLLVDVGTNGEMVLYSNGKLVSCSTAAGPAFEGRELEMGMPAVTGAINHVYTENGTLRFNTINDGKPIGICGTGVISAMRVMLDVGLLDETGAISEEDSTPYSRYIVEKDDNPTLKIGDSDVLLTQRDIRKIQLAKGAIAAGIQTMLDKTDTPVVNVGDTFLCGGFGSYIVPVEAVRIGLFPQELLGSIHTSGNTAGIGATILLFSEETRKQAEEIADRTTDLELSGNPIFTENYMEQMMFW